MKKLKALGFSAMMHGYMVFDANDDQLFRSVRGATIFRSRASNELTALFDYPIPQRWSMRILSGDS